jgi:hypothetical protein
MKAVHFFAFLIIVSLLSCEGSRKEINIYNELNNINKYFNNDFEMEIIEGEYIIEIINPNDTILENIRNISIKYQDEMEEKLKDYTDYVFDDKLLFKNQDYHQIETYINFILETKFKPLSRNMKSIMLQRKVLGKNKNGILLLKTYYYKYYSNYEKQEIIVGIQKGNKFYLYRKIINGSYSRLIYNDKNIDNIFLEI